MSRCAEKGGLWGIQCLSRWSCVSHLLFWSQRRNDLSSDTNFADFLSTFSPYMTQTEREARADWHHLFQWWVMSETNGLPMCTRVNCEFQEQPAEMWRTDVSLSSLTPDYCQKLGNSQSSTLMNKSGLVLPWSLRVINTQEWCTHNGNVWITQFAFVIMSL